MISSCPGCHCTLMHDEQINGSCTNCGATVPKLRKAAVGIAEKNKKEREIKETALNLTNQLVHFVATGQMTAGIKKDVAALNRLLGDKDDRKKLEALYYDLKSHLGIIYDEEM